MIDYKIKEIIEEADFNRVTYRFFEGEDTAQKEYDFDSGRDKIVRRYRRINILGEKSVVYPRTVALRDELNILLNVESIRLGTTTIEEQKVSISVTK